MKFASFLHLHRIFCGCVVTPPRKDDILFHLSWELYYSRVIAKLKRPSERFPPELAARSGSEYIMARNFTFEVPLRRIP